MQYYLVYYYLNKQINTLNDIIYIVPNNIFRMLNPELKKVMNQTYACGYTSFSFLKRYKLFYPASARLDPCMPFELNYLLQ